MGMASSSALDTLEAPGASPTTTQYVFLETEPGEVPPLAIIAASAPSREYPSTDPVTTTALPLSVCSSTCLTSGSTSASPDALSLS